jgi:hypothetical protein
MESGRGPDGGLLAALPGDLLLSLHLTLLVGSLHD